MLDIKKIYEDAMVAADAAPAGDVQQPGAISNTDILGTCDHNKECGYMKDGCFHFPAGTKPKIVQREILAGKKKKKHKNDYIKNMEVIS